MQHTAPFNYDKQSFKSCMHDKQKALYSNKFTAISKLWPLCKLPVNNWKAVIKRLAIARAVTVLSTEMLIRPKFDYKTMSRASSGIHACCCQALSNFESIAINAHMAS